MTILEDSNPPAELSAQWSKYYLCTPNQYPFKLVVRGVERTIKSYAEHHTIVTSNCLRYEEEKKLKSLTK